MLLNLTIKEKTESFPLRSEATWGNKVDKTLFCFWKVEIYGRLGGVLHKEQERNFPRGSVAPLLNGTVVIVFSSLRVQLR